MFGSPCSTTKTFPVHSPTRSARFRSSDLRPFFPRDHTWTKKLRMVKKKNPQNHRSPNDWFYAGTPGCFAALPQPSGTPVSQGRGLPELTPSGTAAERLTQLLARSETFLKAVHTYHSLLVADMSHEEVKEGSSLFACLTNAITSSNLPFKPLV